MTEKNHNHSFGPAEIIGVVFLSLCVFLGAGPSAFANNAASPTTARGGTSKPSLSEQWKVARNDGVPLSEFLIEHNDSILHLIPSLPCKLLSRAQRVAPLMDDGTPSADNDYLTFPLDVESESSTRRYHILFKIERHYRKDYQMGIGAGTTSVTNIEVGQTCHPVASISEETLDLLNTGPVIYFRGMVVQGRYDQELANSKLSHLELTRFIPVLGSACRIQDCIISGGEA